jgi:hypothetical protein
MNFDVKKDAPFEALGISRERNTELSEQFKAVCLTEPATFGAYHEALTKIPKTPEECYWIGFIAGRFFEEHFAF